MKTFSQFCAEAYDADVMGSSQIRKTGEGGRVGSDRRLSDAETRRRKRVGGGKTEPAKRYSDRKDIGTQRSSSERQQQPTQERGSAEVKQSYADKVKAERRAAARKRAAEKASGGTASTSSKAKSRDLDKEGSKLLSKKKPTAEREKQVKMTRGEYTRDEKRRIKREGRRKLRDLVLQSTGKKKESELKNKYTSSGDES
jgi:hypothetical protein